MGITPATKAACGRSRDRLSNDLVKIAIDREPSRSDLKLKLAEIYFVWGNRDLFLDAARDMYETPGVRDLLAASFDVEPEVATLPGLHDEVPVFRVVPRHASVGAA